MTTNVAGETSGPPFSEGEANRLIQVSAIQREATIRAEQERWDAHAREHALHEKEHDQQSRALDTALAAVKEGETNHRIAHDREHEAHLQRHADQAEAVRKAEQSVDKRLEGMNEFREQLNAQANTFATKDQLDALIKTLDQRFDTGSKHTDERYEENRRRIEALEKRDLATENKAEGKSLGQGTVIAIILGGITAATAIISLIILIANIVTAHPVQ